MLIKNRYFIYSIAFVLFQQVSLAISTYFIALAGRSLSDSNLDAVRNNIVIFFLFALTAYLLSSCATFLQVRLKNSEWRRYVENIFSVIGHEQNYSSKKNQQDSISWLTGEAPATLEEASRYLVELTSVYFNVIFTLIVFYLTLGEILTNIVTTSVLIAIISATLSKKHIIKAADNIQNSKIIVFRGIHLLWSNHFFGNRYLKDQAIKEYETTSNKHLQACEYYTFVEQMLASAPIYLTVISMVAALYIYSLPLASIGAFIAVLPRTLQLLGNVHALSVYNSRFFLVLQKLKNLNFFIAKLSPANLRSQVHTKKLTIIDMDTKDTIPADIFMDNIQKRTFVRGRYQITGSNGVGKSSFLKLIKEQDPDAILIAPEMSLLKLPDESEASSGEKLFKQLEHVFSVPTQLYLLDEWDANLDRNNTEKLDSLIDTIKNDALVIEVRHLK